MGGRCAQKESRRTPRGGNRVVQPPLTSTMDPITDACNNAAPGTVRKLPLCSMANTRQPLFLNSMLQTSDRAFRIAGSE